MFILLYFSVFVTEWLEQLTGPHKSTSEKKQKFFRRNNGRRSKIRLRRTGNQLRRGNFYRICFLTCQLIHPFICSSLQTPVPACLLAVKSHISFKAVNCSFVFGVEQALPNLIRLIIWYKTKVAILFFSSTALTERFFFFKIQTRSRCQKHISSDREVNFHTVSFSFGSLF